MPGKLSWGVLGASGIALKAVVPAIQASTNGRVVALASRRRQPDELTKSLGIDRVHESYDELLADSEVRAVYIPLPNSMHKEWVIRAAEAGKAILCEKPMALDAADAQEMAEVCKQRGVPLMEAFMYRFHPQTKRALELLHQGAIGELCEVRAHLSVRLLDLLDPGDIRFNPALGGGTLLDMGCYTVDVARRFFGETPHRVRAWSEIDPKFGVDINMAAILEFSGGRVALPSSNFLAGAQGAYLIVGSKGMIEVPRGIIPGLGSRVPEGLVIVVDEDGRRREENFAAVDHYRLMAEAFAEAVLAGSPVPFSPADSVENMRVLDAITRASRSGSVEDV